MIPLSVPHLNGNEWEYVKDCLDTGWISSAGSYVNRFEQMIAEYTGARYGVACMNGTSAAKSHCSGACARERGGYGQVALHRTEI